MTDHNGRRSEGARCGRSSRYFPDYAGTSQKPISWRPSIADYQWIGVPLIVRLGRLYSARQVWHPFLWPQPPRQDRRKKRLATRKQFGCQVALIDMSHTFNTIEAITGRYNIIYADPPWLYDNSRDDNPAMGGSTYPKMTPEEIGALPIARIAAPDCALFLWATMPKLKEALDVIDAWGFRYITCAFVWVKTNPNGIGIYSGLGHWTNQNSELCLFAKRGRPERISKEVKQICLAPVEDHSTKPPEIRDRILALMGNLPRIELFARHIVPDWDYFGNEVLAPVSSFAPSNRH